jgi:cell division protein FtsB
MTVSRGRPGLGQLAFYAVALVAGFAFIFAAVQGDYGVFRRVQIEAEKEALTIERDLLRLEFARMENLTRRLSDAYLDLDLLDERARDLLGYVRSDEIVIH